MKIILTFVIATLATGTAPAQHVQKLNYCGELKNHFGPLDYRQRGKVNLEIVEDAHFTPEVEAGSKGRADYLGGDLDYTLRAIPNHVRALATMAKVGIRNKSVHLRAAKYPVECYFNRAIRFAPDDAAVQATYGTYLSSLGRTEDALKAFSQAVRLQPDDPTINYNAGLLYLKVKNYDKALLHAKKAYEKDFPLPGLKNKLVALGKWEEPVKAPAAEAAQAPVK